VAIIDERLVRVGSANLNNRSAGFDTECDLAIEATSRSEAAAIARFRARLLGHFAHAPEGEVELMIAELGLAGATDALARASNGRLVRMQTLPMGPLASLVAAYHLGDPTDASDSWRPLRRRRRLKSESGLVALEAEVDH